MHIHVYLRPRIQKESTFETLKDTITYNNSCVSPTPFPAPPGVVAYTRHAHKPSLQADLALTWKWVESKAMLQPQFQLEPCLSLYVII